MGGRCDKLYVTMPLLWRCGDGERVKWISPAVHDKNDVVHCEFGSKVLRGVRDKCVA